MSTSIILRRQWETSLCGLPLSLLLSLPRGSQTSASGLWVAATAFCLKLPVMRERRHEGGLASSTRPRFLFFLRESAPPSANMPSAMRRCEVSQGIGHHLGAAAMLSCWLHGQVLPSRLCSHFSSLKPAESDSIRETRKKEISDGGSGGRQGQYEVPNPLLCLKTSTCCGGDSKHDYPQVLRSGVWLG